MSEGDIAIVILQYIDFDGEKHLVMCKKAEHQMVFVKPIGDA